MAEARELVSGAEFKVISWVPSAYRQSQLLSSTSSGPFSASPEISEQATKHPDGLGAQGQPAQTTTWIEHVAWLLNLVLREFYPFHAAIRAL